MCRCTWRRWTVSFSLERQRTGMPCAGRTVRGVLQQRCSDCSSDARQQVGAHHTEFAPIYHAGPYMLIWGMSVALAPRAVRRKTTCSRSFFASSLAMTCAGMWQASGDDTRASRPQPVARPAQSDIRAAGRPRTTQFGSRGAAGGQRNLDVLQCFDKPLLEVSMVQQVRCSEAHQGVACEVGLLASRGCGPVASATSDARGSQACNVGWRAVYAGWSRQLQPLTHAPTTHVMLSGSGLPVTAHA